MHPTVGRLVTFLTAQHKVRAAFATVMSVRPSICHSRESRLNASFCHFVIFKYISTKLGGKVHISLFNSCVKFHAKILMHY